MVEKVVLASPRGFCAGVVRAIDIVNIALEAFDDPLFVRKEIVHNRHVVEDLREKGVVFVDELAEVPEGERVIFSAHGVSPEVWERARAKSLKVIDATCPLVTKVHMEVIRHRKKGDEVILIGHAGHPEVEGTLGQVEDGVTLVETAEDVPGLEIADPKHLAYVTQTTLSVDDTSRVVTALKQRFPEITGPKKNDICYATQNRQDAVKSLAKQCDVVLVVGSPNSSNSNRLREVAEGEGIPAYMVDGPEDIERSWIDNIERIGITAGASAPEVLVQQVVDRLKGWGVDGPDEVQGREENVVFALPKELRAPTVSAPTK